MVVIVTQTEIAKLAIRCKINEILYCLKADIDRIEGLQDLIKERDQEIKEAYNFSYGVTNWYQDENVPGFSADPYYLSSKIIGLKEWYNKRIERIKRRRNEIEQLLNSLPSDEAETLRNAFFTANKVDEQDVKGIIKKHLPKFEKIYLNDKIKSEDKGVYTADYVRDYHKQFEGKKQYFVDGKFKYMTEEEYQNFLEEKERKYREFFFGLRS